jgi:hypothetical protein
MRIVSLEDDEPFWDLMHEALLSAFSNVQLEWINSESTFYKRVPEFINSPPDLFLLDVMVKWADASPDMTEPPTEVEAEKYFRAGLRCHRKLLKNDRTATIPVVLYTVLEQSDMNQAAENIPSHVVLASKTGDLNGLIAIIKELGGVPRPHISKSSS